MVRISSKSLSASVDVPSPFVSWQTMVTTQSPALQPTRSRYRTLVKNGLASPGIRLVNRTATGVAGSVTIHSVLNLVALHAERRGDSAAAQILMNGAIDIESNFGPLLRKQLETSTPAAAEESTLYRDIVHATYDCLSMVDTWSELVSASGVIEQLDSTSAHVSGRQADGSLSHVDVPRSLVDSWRLEVGDKIFVLQHRFPGSVLVEVIPTAESLSGFAFTDVAAALNAEFSEMARVYEAEIMAGLKAEEVEFLSNREITDDQPRRKIRL